MMIAATYRDDEVTRHSELYPDAADADAPGPAAETAQPPAAGPGNRRRARQPDATSLGPTTGNV